MILVLHLLNNVQCEIDLGNSSSNIIWSPLSEYSSRFHKLLIHLALEYQQ